MDSEGYPDEKDLELIRKWEESDFMGLLSFLDELVTYGEDCLSYRWKNDNIWGLLLEVEFHTLGWSGNEEIIRELLDKQYWKMFWYYKWITGGHYWFRIKPGNVGYKKVSEYCKEKNVSRQSVYQSSEKFKWIFVSDKIRLIKEK